MADKKKRVKKTAGVKQTAKQSVKQTVKVVVGDTGKKKATRRRRPTTSKGGPSNIPPSFGGKSGVGTSDRVVIPPQSRADPSLYNKDALLALQNQIKQLEYKADNAQVNLAGYLGNIMQNRLTNRNDASLEAPEVVVEEETKKKKKEPTEQDVRMKKILDLAEVVLTSQQKREFGYEASAKKQRGRSKQKLTTEFLPGTVGGELGRTLSNQFQQQQINKGIASEKAEEKKQEISQPNFIPIGATSMPNKPIVYDDDDEGSKTPELVIEGMDFFDEVPEEKPKKKKAPLFKNRNK